MHHNLNRYAANFEAGCNNDMLWEPLILKLDPFLRILKVDIQKIIAKYLADLSDAISKAVPHVPANLLVDDSGLGVIEEQVVVEKLESMYQKLRSMKAERMAVLARFRDMINNDDITGILVLNPGREGSIIQQEKSKFVPITGQLKQECNSSAQLLQGLVSEFDKLKTQGYTIRNIEIKESIKAQISEDWMMSIQSVFELRNAMNDAHNFYKELRDSVEQIGIQINQFVNGRKSEARVLSQRIDFLQTHSLQDHMAQTRISEAAAYPTTQDPRAMNQSIYQMPSIDADSLSPGYNNDMSRRESKSNSPKGFSQPPAAHYYYQQNLHNQNIERESYTSTGGNVHVRQTQIPPVYGQSYAEHSNVQPNYDTSFSDHSEKYHIAPQSQVPHQQSYSPAVGGLPPPVPFDQPVNSVGMGNIRPYVMPSNMAGNYHQAGSYPRLNEPMHGNPISSPPLYSNSQPSFYHHNQDAYSNQSPLHGHLQDQSPGQPRVPNQEQGLLD